MNLNKKREGGALSSPLILMIIALLCTFLWGSASPAIKVGKELMQVEGVSSIMLFAGIRFAFAGVLTIIIFSIARRKILIPKPKNIGRILTVSVFQTVIQYIFFYLGLAYTTGVKGTVTSGSGAFFAVLAAALIFKQEKLTVKKIVACAIGFAGIIFINFEGLAFTDDMKDVLGVIFVLISAISNSVSSVLIKKFSAHEDPVVISGYQFIVGGVFLIVVGLAFGGKVSFGNPVGVSVLVYLMFLSAIAYSLWGLLLKYNPVSRVTVYNFTTPIFGTILSLIFLRDENSSLSFGNLAITLVLVSVGILLLNYVPKKQTHLRKFR